MDLRSLGISDWRVAVGGLERERIARFLFDVRSETCHTVARSISHHKMMGFREVFSGNRQGVEIR